MKLTDHELRLKLLELGVNVGPIIDNTRCLWTKKYEKILQEQRKEKYWNKKSDFTKESQPQCKWNSAASWKCNFSFRRCSFCIPLLLVVFFELIYMRESQPNQLDAKSLLCNEEEYILEQNQSSFSGYSCIKKEFLTETLEFSNELYSLLYEAAIDHYCGSREDASMLTSKAESNLKNAHPEMDSLRFNITFTYSLLVIKESKRFNVKFDKTADFYKRKQWWGIEKLEIIEPYISYWLRFKLVLCGIFLKLLGVILIAGVTVTLYVIIKYKIKQTRENERIVYSVVDNIIRILEEQYHKSLVDKNEKPYLPISHIRDMLIPIVKRKACLYHWLKAVEFIESYESRIKIEYEYYAGEKFKVWKWIQISNPKKESKYFQAQALDFKSSSSATSYIMIRNILPPNYNNDLKWTNVVKQAILAKCEDPYQIMGIQVDYASKDSSVYVRFRNVISAQKAYETFKDWIYEGRLVIVESIDPELYHSKFL